MAVAWGAVGCEPGTRQAHEMRGFVSRFWLLRTRGVPQDPLFLDKNLSASIMFSMKNVASGVKGLNTTAKGATRKETVKGIAKTKKILLLPVSIWVRPDPHAHSNITDLTWKNDGDSQFCQFLCQWLPVTKNCNCATEVRC